MRKKSGLELEKLLGESRRKLRALRFDLVSGKVKNIREIRKIKKTIARILTILKERK
jgi:large subunit ribosomal protein L29